MEHEKLIRQGLYSLISIWAVLLLPSILLAVLVLQNEVSFINVEPFTHSILYYNALLFPFVLIICAGVSYYCTSKQEYKRALLAALFPFLSILIELIAADLALLFL